MNDQEAMLKAIGQLFGNVRVATSQEDVKKILNDLTGGDKLQKSSSYFADLLPAIGEKFDLSYDQLMTAVIRGTFLCMIEQTLFQLDDLNKTAIEEGDEELTPSEAARHAAASYAQVILKEAARIVTQIGCDKVWANIPSLDSIRAAKEQREKRNAEGRKGQAEDRNEADEAQPEA